ncbi:MAG: hypothetical protein IT427_12715 [Pirellulales bacterium]|nr:hypothetical protein [Pirellulales bacterium]
MKRLLLIATIFMLTGTLLVRADELSKSFASPPIDARPWVYWFPLDGNLTKEGITADLEAMARVGIGGVLFMEVDFGEPKGSASFARPLWWEMLLHAGREAERLGIQINMNNDAGWCGSGGPWVTPELSMQKVVWTETIVDGPRKFAEVLAKPDALHGYYRDIAVLAMPAPSGQARIQDIAGKSAIHPQHFPPQPATFLSAPADAVIPRDKIRDVSVQLDKDGKLTWDVPAGKWLVMRFGHTTTGKDNHPAPESGRGLECDKFSQKATQTHYQALMGKLVANYGPLVGKALVSTHIDSWETGSQNWTPRMREEFQQRRGYDLLPFLPTYAGYVVDSSEVSERFLWDLRQTVSDLIVQVYAGSMRQLANDDGLRLSIEAYDGDPCDEMTYGGQADEPMAEFWTMGYDREYTCTAMASSAHTYGKRIVGAESFSSTEDERWLKHPGSIKALGDWAFCQGINRFVFHRYAAQPWTHVAPGMSMGPFGVHYERTQTWWEQSKAWHDYLTRCQYLLRQGLFVADLLYLQPEGAPRRFSVPPENPKGYCFDGCTREVLLTRAAVKDARIVLPDGMSYRALVLPRVETMTPTLLRKIDELVAAGATVFAAEPPRKAPGLSDWPNCDAQVQELADKLWAGGKLQVLKETDANARPGAIYAHAAAIGEWFTRNGLPPDFSATPHLLHIHRATKEADLYFVVNPEPRQITATANFRVAGKQPEFWWPDTGRIAPAVAFSEKDGLTNVPLELEPNGSVFVVFRKPSAGIDPVVRATLDGQPLLEPSPPPKIIVQSARYGVLDDPRRTRDVKAELQCLVDSNQKDFPVARLAEGGDPAKGIVKTLVADYTADGRPLTFNGQDPGIVRFGANATSDAPPLDIARGQFWQSGNYLLNTAGGKTFQFAVSLPAPREIAGSWEVAFDPRWGGPEKVTFDSLEDWTTRPEAGIKYYSGAATYRTTFQSDAAKAKSRIFLDLGRVEVLAEVALNGKPLGTLWKRPFRVDVTDAIQPGANDLEIKIVNLWANRQIGDEQLPEDSDRNPDGTLKSWPTWLTDGKPSPAGRYAFTSWRLWKKNDSLVSSGLLGPVIIRYVENLEFP